MAKIIDVENYITTEDFISDLKFILKLWKEDKTARNYYEWSYQRSQGKEEW